MRGVERKVGALWPREYLSGVRRIVCSLCARDVGGGVEGAVTQRGGGSKGRGLREEEGSVARGGIALRSLTEWRARMGAADCECGDVLHAGARDAGTVCGEWNERSGSGGVEGVEGEGTFQRRREQGMRTEKGEGSMARGVVH